MSLYVDDVDMQIHVGDALTVLRTLPDESVHMCVTSPPYFGLRCYGVDGQLGLEATPEEYVQALVDVFAEVRRVLRADGTCWLNLGDSYGAGSRTTSAPQTVHGGEWRDKNPGRVTGIASKQLVGIPWRVAFALQADGWYLRSDIVWSKPNPMPESVTDRPTKAHEYLFLLTRSPRYFFDAEAVREPHARLWDARTNGGSMSTERHHEAHIGGTNRHERPYPEPNPAGRNVRSVWEIATQPYPQAHFATFPEALPERCILAGTSERGCCPECGAPWERVVEVERLKPSAPSGNREMGRWDYPTGGIPHDATRRRDTGWRPSCDCYAPHNVHGETDPRVAIEAVGGIVPCVVLDPFLGSGTTALVARRLGRRCIGIELSSAYAALAADRTRQLSLLAGEASA